MLRSRDVYTSDASWFWQPALLSLALRAAGCGLRPRYLGAWLSHPSSSVRDPEFNQSGDTRDGQHGRSREKPPPKPRPVSHDTTAPRTAPPAPTGAITLPTQLMKFRKAPSGCAPVSPCTATLNCGLVPRFWATTSCPTTRNTTASTTRGFFHPRIASCLLT